MSKKDGHVLRRALDSEVEGQRKERSKEGEVKEDMKNAG